MARPRRRALLGGIASALGVLACIWAIPAALLVPVTPGGALTLVLVAAAITPLPLLLVIQSRMRGWYPGRWFRLLVLRPFWYAQLCVLLLPIGAVAGMAFGLVVGRVVDGGRLGMAVLLVVFAVAAVFGYVDSRLLRTTRLIASWPDLPDAFEGFTIVQLTDLHVGPHSSRAFMRAVVDRTRAAGANIIVVTGDLIDDFDEDVAVYAAAFGDLRAPDGVYVIPGNHDVYADWPKVRARLDRLPVTVLVNGIAIVERGDAQLCIIGTGDPAGNPWGPDTAAPRIDDAVRLVPHGAFPIALAHNPALWPALAERGVRLTLSGHTHWGQFAIPRLGWSLASAFLTHAMGGYREGESLLYVHPGTGYWGIPFRLGAPPEVAILELRRGETGLTRSVA